MPFAYNTRTRGLKKKHEFIAEHAEELLLELQEQQVDWQEVFGKADLSKPAKPSKLSLEIGFGSGEVLLHNAAANPQDFFIGIEIYVGGIVQTLKEIKERGLDNIRLIRGDASLAVEHMFAPDSLDAVQILFPDPWPKKRHHKRRLLRQEFLETLLGKLKQEGVLHLATDWQEYAEETLECLTTLEERSKLQNLATDPSGFMSSPQLDRPITRFEKRAGKEKRPTYEFLFKKL